VSITVGDLNFLAVEISPTKDMYHLQSDYKIKGLLGSVYLASTQKDTYLSSITVDCHSYSNMRTTLMSSVLMLAFFGVISSVGNPIPIERTGLIEVDKRGWGLKGNSSSEHMLAKRQSNYCGVAFWYEVDLG